MQVPEKQGVTKDLRGVQLRAFARLFQEFDLLSGEELVLRLKYAFNARTEEQGGFTFRCDYQSEQWNLDILRAGLLQLESYRLFMSGTLVASLSGRWAFLPAKLTFSDGATFTCVRGLYRTQIRDSKHQNIASARVRWTGSLLGSSAIRVEQAADPDRVIPFLLILLHMSTRNSN